MLLLLDEQRWQTALDLARGWVTTRKVPAITVITGTRDRMHGPVSFGSLRVDEHCPLPVRPIYLVASITKPLVGLGALRLIEQGRLTLSDRVVDFLPTFGRHGKVGIEIRHLLTHSSGLPDMLPNNRELRAAHAPRSKFVEETCQQKPGFSPGRGVQYQSTGFAVLGAVIEKIDGRPLPQFLSEEFFRPAGMTETALGAPDEWFEPGGNIERVPDIRLPTDQVDTDWNWNSRYWRQLGAPWGGLLTTAEDMAALSQLLLREGRTSNGHSMWSPNTIAAATRNQFAQMREIPEEERRCRPWGLGWRLHWPAHSANFGDLLGPQTYGHWGATGTVIWIDPQAGTFCVILSTEPQEPTGFFLSRLSNAVAAAWC
ncbi:MAG: serine hydrolase domain-containing protein [Planctomycetaceae bacterium]|nr:serine hydrolase domain-containing protein [Planctomycetaceae bacterium]